jgi:hypothetical protein
MTGFRDIASDTVLTLPQVNRFRGSANARRYQK